MGIRTKYIPIRYSDDDSVWCIWKVLGAGHAPVEPYGRTVAQLQDDDEDDLNYLDEGLECGCGWPDPEFPYQPHDDYIEAYEHPEHEPSPEWNPPELQGSF